MVNFRFHLISLIAVFLALGLGVLMGSTVVQEAIVDRLDREIADVRNESNQRKAENDRLKDELNRANAYMDDSAAFAVNGRLPSVPVAVLAERGVDGGAVADAVALVAIAGADVPAVFWLEDTWQLDDAEQVQSLRDAVDATGDADAVRGQALDALVARLAGPPAASATPTTATTTAGETPADVLSALRDAGFLSIDGDEAAVAAFPDEAASVLVVTGSQSHLLGTDTTLDLTRSLADAGVPTVVGEVFVDLDDEDAPDRGEAVAPIRADDELPNVVSTLDDLELVQGRVTAVLALEAAAEGIVGHYGYGSGATRSVPEPRPPPQP